ncbi:MAG: hypothetical protein WHT81_00695, partial [Rectinemataceae bacterium]
GETLAPEEPGAVRLARDEQGRWRGRIVVQDPEFAGQVVLVVFAVDRNGKHLYSGHGYASAEGGTAYVTVQEGYASTGPGTENWGPAGGYVFWKDEASGLYYEVAPVDVPPAMAWAIPSGGAPQPSTGADGSLPGTGKANTLAVLQTAGLDGSAAQACYEWTWGGYSNASGGDLAASPSAYQGWFLPSSGEWSLLAAQLAAVPGLALDLGLTAARYWTSTETASASALAASPDGTNPPAATDKSTVLPVRAIRTFGYGTVRNPAVMLGSGAMLVRYGNYLYRLGGKDASGTLSDKCYMAALEFDAGGNPLPLNWVETAAMPAARAYGAAFAGRDRMYVLGGEGPSGPTSTIFVTAINSDGTLGYGTSHFWEVSLNPMASPRSHMGWAVHDGRVFLIGGLGPAGPEKSIVHARMWQTTGWPGVWYASPQELPAELFGLGATIEGGRLYVAGGYDSSGLPSTQVTSWALGADGLLSDPQGDTLPEAIGYPICLGDEGALIIGGGYRASNMPSSKVYRREGALWSLQPSVANAQGPSVGRARDAVWCMKNSQSVAEPVVERLDGLGLPPEAPLVLPGSGMVPTNTAIQLKAAPDTTVRYRTDHAPVTVSDPVWNEASPLKITADTLMAFRAFAADGTPSAQVNMDYRVRPASFFVWVSGDFTLKEVGDTTLQNISLTDNMFNPATTGYTGIWGRLVVSSPTAIALTVRDAACPGYEAVYTGRVRFSLFEGDLYTEVVDIEGKAVRNLLPPTATQPILLYLNPGAYYLRIDDLDGLSGRTVGAAFRKR